MLPSVRLTTRFPVSRSRALISAKARGASNAQEAHATGPGQPLVCRPSLTTDPGAMAAAGWWCWPLPAWLGSGAAWFVALNLVVGAIFALSSRGRPQTPSPRRGGITRRASSAVLQRLRSFNIFSFPSSSFHFHTAEPSPGASAEGTTTRRSPSIRRAVAPPAAAETVTPGKAEEDVVELEDESSMSMDEAYARALAGRQPTEEEAGRWEVDAKAEEFIRGFKEDLRQQRLNSIFNYTQMLKRRAAAAGRPVASPSP